MPTEPQPSQKKAPKASPSNAKQRGHFLTALDRSYLREGPEPKQKTRRIYRGKRIDQERRAYKVQYARVVREAKRDARGALEDLAFLARTMDPEWLYDLITESHHLYPPTEVDYPEPLQRHAVTLTGRREAPLEEVLRHAAKAIGWERWVKSDYAEGRAINTGRRGERVAVRLAGSIEQGLNDAEEEPLHQVSITTRKPGEATVWRGPMSGLPRVR